jgi:hypothetical protein
LVLDTPIIIHLLNLLSPLKQINAPVKLWLAEKHPGRHAPPSAAGGLRPRQFHMGHIAIFFFFAPHAGSDNFGPNSGLTWFK